MTVVGHYQELLGVWNTPQVGGALPRTIFSIWYILVSFEGDLDTKFVIHNILFRNTVVIISCYFYLGNLEDFE